MEKQTLTIAAEFQRAYDYFNEKLFGGSLPECVITLRQKPKSAGYYSHQRFASTKGQRADEIAMNPALFSTRALPETLSTLAHEMVHHWQAHRGKKKPRGRYHNREWASKMLEIGLHPTADLTLQGAMVGDHVTHVILPGGLFQRVARDLIAAGFGLTWYDYFAEVIISPTKFALDPEYRKSVTELARSEQSERRSALVVLANEGEDKPGDLPFEFRETKQTRTKFTCPGCGDSAWGRKDLVLICGKCQKGLLAEGEEAV